METYQPQDAQEIQDVVKRIFAPIFEAALKGEMQNHLGYANHGAVNARQARERFEQFQKDWASDLGAVAVWQNNFTHVEQLFSYGSAVRKVMYTTNAIESVNSSFRNVTKKGSFSNEDAVFKLLYLRV